MYADSQIIRLGIPAMARWRYAFDEDKIARFQKEGRGQGRGTSYKPWLTIQDVASHGRSHRIAGIKTGRVHHFLSGIERWNGHCGGSRLVARIFYSSAMTPFYLLYDKVYRIKLVGI